VLSARLFVEEIPWRYVDWAEALVSDRQTGSNSHEHIGTVLGHNWQYAPSRPAWLYGGAARTDLCQTIEPVCGTPKRKLEIGPQRLAPQTQQYRAENLEILEQRLGRVSLPRGNVGGSHTRGNRTAGTELPGWA